MSTNSLLTALSDIVTMCAPQIENRPHYPGCVDNHPFCKISSRAQSAVNNTGVYLKGETVECPMCARLRKDLMDPPGDVQEAVLRKLDLWPYFGRKYHANGHYWSGVPTLDLPCDFCARSVVEHDPRTHACLDRPSS